MHNISHTIIKYGIWALIFTVSSYAYAVSTWNEPACNPNDPAGPAACNADAPLHTGEEDQIKIGGLALHGIAGETDPETGETLYTGGQFEANGVVSTGDGYFATNISVGTAENPFDHDLVGLFDGKVGATEFCDTSGNNCVSPEVIFNSINNNDDDGLSCPQFRNHSTLPGGPRTTAYRNNEAWDTGGVVYSFDASGTNARGGWDIITIPPSTLTACKSDIGCVIKEKVYKKTAIANTNPQQYVDKLYKIKTYNYIQDTAGTAQAWTSSYSKGANGNTTSSNIVGPINYLYLRDDSTNAETLASQWSSYDNHQAYGREIYICTYTE